LWCLYKDSCLKYNTSICERVGLLLNISISNTWKICGLIIQCSKDAYEENFECSFDFEQDQKRNRQLFNLWKQFSFHYTIDTQLDVVTLCPFPTILIDVCLLGVQRDITKQLQISSFAFTSCF